MRRGVLLLIFATLLFAGSNQGIIWQKTYGSDTTDVFYDITTIGNSYCVAVGGQIGTTGYNFYIVGIIDSTGDTLWTNTPGGIDHEQAYAVAWDSLNNFLGSPSTFITSGYTYSFGNGLCDMLSYRCTFEGNGEILDTLVFGGGSYDIINDVAVGLDSDYIMVGYSGNDIWIVKYDPETQDTVWTRTYGTDSLDVAKGVAVDPKSGYYFVVGFTKSFGNYYQAWILKIDPSTGDTMWTKVYGGPGVDAAYSIAALPNEPYCLVAGYTTSYGNGGHDMWLLKIDYTTGDTVWTRTYGGASADEANTVVRVDSEYSVVSGFTTSFGAGSYDFFSVVVRNSDGKPVWYGTYGGSDLDVCYGSEVDRDGYLLLAGKTKSFGAGAEDGIVYKIDLDSMELLRITGLYPGVLNAGSSRKLQIYGNGFEQYSISELSLHFVDNTGADVYSIHPDSIVSDNRLIFNIPSGALSPGYYDIYISAGRIVISDTIYKEVFVSAIDTTHRWWHVDSIAHVGNQVRNMTQGDGNNDGNVEIYATSYDNNVYRIYYNGTWHTDVIYTASYDTRYITVGDGDNDGKNEVYITEGNASSSSELVRLKWDGVTWNADTIYHITRNFEDVIIADIDNDGENEVITSSEDLYIFRWDGSTWNTEVVTVRNGYVYDIVAADADNDGKMEVYAGIGGSNWYDDARIVRIYMDSDTFVVKTVVYKHWSERFQTLAIGDIDNNGILEVYGSLTGYNELLSYTHAGSNWNELFRIVGGGDFRQILVSDIDGDGVSDVYAGNNDNMLYFEKSYSGHYSYLKFDNSDVISVSYLDYDNDGKLELFVGTQKGNIYMIKRDTLESPTRKLKIYKLTADNANVNKTLFFTIYGAGFTSNTVVTLLKSDNSYVVGGSTWFRNNNEISFNSDTIREPGYYSVIVSDGVESDTLRNAVLINTPSPYNGEDAYYVIDSLMHSGHSLKAVCALDMDSDGKTEIYVLGDSLGVLYYDGTSYTYGAKINIPGIAQSAFYAPWINDSQKVIYVASDDHNLYEITYESGAYSYHRVNPTNNQPISYAESLYSVTAFDMDGDNLTEIITGGNQGKIHIFKFSSDGKIVNETRRAIFEGNSPHVTGLDFVDQIGYKAQLYISGGSTSESPTLKRISLYHDNVLDNDVFVSSRSSGYLYLNKTDFLKAIFTSDSGTLWEILYSGSAYGKDSIYTNTTDFYSLVCGDVDNDGIYELWLGDGRGKIYEFGYDGTAYYRINDFNLTDSRINDLVKADLEGDGKVEVYAVTEAGDLFRIEKKPYRDLYITNIKPEVIYNDTISSLRVYGSGFAFYDKDIIKIEIFTDSTSITFKPDSIVSNNEMIVKIDGSLLSTGYKDVSIDADTITTSNTLKNGIFVGQRFHTPVWYTVDFTIGHHSLTVRKIAIGDKDNDGVPEGYASFSRKIYKLKYSNGSWDDNAYFIYETSEEIRDMAIGDPDYDGTNELYVATGDDGSGGSVLRLTGEPPNIQSTTILSGPAKYTALAIGDINNDGKKELCVVSESGMFYSVIWEDTLWHIDSLELSLSGGLKDINFGSIEGDGKIKTYVTQGDSANGGKIFEVHYTGGSLVSTTLISKTDGDGFGKIYLYDANRDLKDEIFVTLSDSSGYSVVKYTYESGSFTKKVIVKGWGMFDDILVGDLDNFETYDVFGCSEDGNIYGVHEGTIEFLSIWLGEKVTSLAFMDADFNGTIDMLAGTQNGNVYWIREKLLDTSKSVNISHLSLNNVSKDTMFSVVIYGRNLGTVSSVKLINDVYGNEIDGYLQSVKSDLVMVAFPPIGKFKGTLLAKGEGAPVPPGYYSLVVSNGISSDTLWGAILVNDTLPTTGETYYNVCKIGNYNVGEYNAHVVADMDGDGKYELYVGGDSLYKITWDGGKYTTVPVAEVPGYITHLEYGDIDNNGTREIVAFNNFGEVFKIYRIALNWRIVPVYTLPVERMIYSAMVCDVDVDGKNEFIFGWDRHSDEPYNGIGMFENYGLTWEINEGRFLGVMSDSGTYNLLDKPLSLAYTDINFDGQPEVYVAGIHGDTLGLYELEYNDTGYARSAIYSQVCTDTAPRAYLRVIDNGDSEIDSKIHLIFFNYVDNTLMDFAFTTHGGYFMFDTIATNMSDIKDIAVGDLDNDGRRELWVPTASGWIYKFVEDSNGYRRDSVVHVNDDITGLIPMDMNGDGFIEMYAVTKNGDIYVITTEKDTVPPSQVHIISPVENSWLNADSVMITWNTVSRILPFGRYSITWSTRMNIIKSMSIDRDNIKSPVFYEIQIASDSVYSDIVFDSMTTDTSFIAIGLPEGIYFVRVRPMDSAGNVGEYSRSVKFGIDRSVPVIDSVITISDTSACGPFEVPVYCHDALSGINKVEFYYRRSEDTDWVNLEAVIDNGAYKGFIPSVGISDDTVKYYIKVTDNALNGKFSPDSAPYVVYEFIAGATGVNERDIIRKFTLNISSVQRKDMVVNLAVPNAMPIELKVYDIQGRLVGVLYNKVLSRGRYSATLKNLRSGVYVYVLKYGNNIKKGKVMVISK